MPTRLVARYHAARTNPALLSVRDDLAVLESRLVDLFARLGSGESRAAWTQLRTTMIALYAATAVHDPPAMRSHLAELHRLIMAGGADEEAWAEIQSLWEARCRLTLTELKVLVAAQQMVSVEQLLLYVGVLTETIQRIVPQYTDPESARHILGALAAEFHRLSVQDVGGGV